MHSRQKFKLRCIAAGHDLEDLEWAEILGRELRRVCKVEVLGTDESLVSRLESHGPGGVSLSLLQLSLEESVSCSLDLGSEQLHERRGLGDHSLSCDGQRCTRIEAVERFEGRDAEARRYRVVQSELCSR